MSSALVINPSTSASLLAVLRVYFYWGNRQGGLIALTTSTVKPRFIFKVQQLIMISF